MVAFVQLVRSARNNKDEKNSHNNLSSRMGSIDRSVYKERHA
jgi:hypothetical protein